MSATLRVIEGAAKVRLNGQTETVGAGWEQAGVTFTPKAAKAATFEVAVGAAMLADIEAPAMGAADVLPSEGVPGQQVHGVIDVLAVGGTVLLSVYRDKTSAHPDETFGQGADVETLVLEDGESWTGEVAHSNAWTIVFEEA